MHDNLPESRQAIRENGDINDWPVRLASRIDDQRFESGRAVIAIAFAVIVAFAVALLVSGTCYLILRVCGLNAWLSLAPSVLAMAYTFRFCAWFLIKQLVSDSAMRRDELRNMS